MSVSNGTEKNTDLRVTWHDLSAEEVLNQLDTTFQPGLSSSEVERRLSKYGPNQLTEKPRPSYLQLILTQLKSFLVIMLIVAALISALLGDYVEAAAILAIVVLNALLGVVQERRAEEALAALKKLASPDAQVMRDGHRMSVPSLQLVPGDIVFLEAGNFTPADVRLLEAVNLQIEEAALTGESVAVQKNAVDRLDRDIPLGDWKNTAFMGTTVTYGRGHGVVVSTGMHTQLGLIASMLQNVEEEDTPLQRQLDNLGKVLGWAALIICGVIFVVGMARSDFSIEAISEMFMIAVSLAIAAVPEGLPAVVTISLAMGMREMVHRHALIRRLASVETLGSATVICSDKTGTLTQNVMTVTRIWVDGKIISVTGTGYKAAGDYRLDDQPILAHDYPGLADTLWVGVLNNDASLEEMQDNDHVSYRIIGDPTEGSLLIAATKAGFHGHILNKSFPRAHEIPFDSERKRMVTVHSIENPLLEEHHALSDETKRDWFAVAVKGAPDVVLNLCTHYEGIDGQIYPLDDDNRQRILAGNDSMTHEALRVLGLAYRLLEKLPAEIAAGTLEKELVFAGLAGMIDPARPEVKPALATARLAGIRTIMITGDYANTARAIAEEIGLLQPGHQVLTGSQLNDLDDSGLQAAVKITDAFARVSPEHKMRIVDALRANHEVVAMTGDGVNDAPAIKLADIGVAMGITGTDVAKETADMVLTDDNYASIVSAIEQGRIIYSNIRKFVYYLISCNMAEIVTIFFATLAGWGSPLTALQLLWLNLVTDGAPALALAAEKGDPDIMNRPPRPTQEPIINRFMRIGVIAQTIAIASVTLIAFRIGISSSEHIQFAETMAFVTLSCSELLRAFTARSEYYSVFKIGIFGNKWMNLAVLSSLALILAVVYIPFFSNVFNTEPLGWVQWAEILPLLLVPSIVAELTKLFFAPRNK